MLSQRSLVLVSIALYRSSRAPRTLIFWPGCFKRLFDDLHGIDAVHLMRSSNFAVSGRPTALQCSRLRTAISSCRPFCGIRRIQTTLDLYTQEDSDEARGGVP